MKRPENWLMLKQKAKTLQIIVSKAFPSRTKQWWISFMVKFSFFHHKQFQGIYTKEKLLGVAHYNRSLDQWWVLFKTYTKLTGTGIDFFVVFPCTKHYGNEKIWKHFFPKVLIQQFILKEMYATISVNMVS